SSRRRHTRSDRDWSSDVCSSDLIAQDYLSKNDLEGAEGEANKAIAYNSSNDDAYVVRGLVSYIRALQAKKTMEVDNCLTGVDAEIGRASCRERVESGVSGGAVMR